MLNSLVYTDLEKKKTQNILIKALFSQWQTLETLPIGANANEHSYLGKQNDDEATNFCFRASPVPCRPSYIQYAARGLGRLGSVVKKNNASRVT